MCGNFYKRCNIATCNYQVDTNVLRVSLLTHGCRCIGAEAGGWPASGVGGRGGTGSSSGPVAGLVDSQGQCTTGIPYQWTVITVEVLSWNNQSFLLLIISLV